MVFLPLVQRIKISSLIAVKVICPKYIPLIGRADLLHALIPAFAFKFIPGVLSRLGGACEFESISCKQLIDGQLRIVMHHIRIRGFHDLIHSSCSQIFTAALREQEIRCVSLNASVNCDHVRNNNRRNRRRRRRW